MLTAMAKHIFRRTFIRQWRQYNQGRGRKMTQEQLAAAIDMVPSALSMLENGQRGYTQDTLEKIAKVLGTTPSALISRPPSDDGDVLTMLEQTAPEQRRQFTRVLRALVRPE